MTVAEASGEYFVTGARGELVAHAMRPSQRPAVYGVWVPGPAPSGQPPVATISPHGGRWVVEEEASVTYDDIADAIVASVRAVLKARTPVVQEDQIDPNAWTMPLAVGLVISALLIVAMIADVIRLAATSLSN